VGSLSVDDVLDATTVDAEVDNDVITVTATAPEAERAAEIANALATAYMDAVEAQVQATADEALTELESTAVELRRRLARVESRLNSAPDDGALMAQRDSVAAQLAALAGRADQVAVDASLYGSGVQLFERAVPPDAPTGSGLVRNTIAGGLVGAVLASMLAWRRSRTHQEAQGRHDPGHVLDIPLIGSVPRFESLGVKGVVPTLTDARSPAGESYQFLVASLSARLRRMDGHVVAVTSPQPGEGKTVTALNLAIAASRDERDVLLVDADARVRGLSRLTQTNDGNPGLHELQQHPDELIWSESRRELKDAPGVEIVPVGSEIADPAGFFRTKGFTDAARRMRDHADLVIYDCPPLLAVSDAWAVAEQVDGIVLVVAQGTPLPVLEETRDRLAQLATPVLGYVFNQADQQGAPYAYHYSQYQSAGTPPPRSTGARFSTPAPTPPSTGAARRDGIAAMQERPKR
jgi:Mrp family chromosome partitioning ATPase/capsular polysaccharide biosynthesis protein